MELILRECFILLTVESIEIRIYTKKNSNKDMIIVKVQPISEHDKHFDCDILAYPFSMSHYSHNGPFIYPAQLPSPEVKPPIQFLGSVPQYNISKLS